MGPHGCNAARTLHGCRTGATSTLRPRCPGWQVAQPRKGLKDLGRQVDRAADAADGFHAASVVRPPPARA